MPSHKRVIRFVYLSEPVTFRGKELNITGINFQLRFGFSRLRLERMNAHRTDNRHFTPFRKKLSAGFCQTVPSGNPEEISFRLLVVPGLSPVYRNGECADLLPG